MKILNTLNADTATDDRIEWVRVASTFLPLANPISDAKVLTGRQKPMTEIAILFAEIETADGHAAWVSVTRSALAAPASSRTPKRSRQR